MSATSFLNQDLGSEDEDDDFEGDDGGDVDGENEPDDDDVDAKSSSKKAKGRSSRRDAEEEEDEDDLDDDLDDEEDEDEDEGDQVSSSQKLSLPPRLFEQCWIVLPERIFKLPLTYKIVIARPKTCTEKGAQSVPRCRSRG